MNPTLGITGITCDDDVETARLAAAHVPPSHRLMAGVLVSAKTLYGGETTNRRYPPARDVNRLLADLGAAGCWPVIHYNSRDLVGLADELGALHRLCPAMRGLQLNIAAPPVDAIEWLHALRPERARWAHFIAQINRAAIGDATGDAAVAAALAYARRYEGCASFALLDLSGGDGKALDVGFAARVIRAWDVENVRVSVAGGLGPEGAPVLAALREAVADDEVFRGLSFDAESRLRVPVADPIPGEKYQDQIDRERALLWITMAADAVQALPRVRPVRYAPTLSR